MGIDTTDIRAAARDFDGYATTLRDHARTLDQAQNVRWQSTSASEYRTVLTTAAAQVRSLATAADDVAASLRAHATSVENHPLARAAADPVGAAQKIAVTVAAPFLEVASWTW